jgi:hypothetical protein
MEIDTIASPASAGFGALGIEPKGIEKVLAEAEE